MELSQQVKNFKATLRHTSLKQPTFRAEDGPVTEHTRALQQLSNGRPVLYQETLRCVNHEGSKQPKLPPRVTQKHPGYIRNESGGVFTS